MIILIAMNSITTLSVVICTEKMDYMKVGGVLKIDSELTTTNRLVIRSEIEAQNRILYYFN